MSTATSAVETTRRCRIEEVFDAGFIELLRLAPRNPSVRALILQITSKMPESSCGTFEEIKEWIETHCEKRISASRLRRRDDGIGITVDFSDTEYGSASYSVGRTGQDQFQIGADDLLSIVQEALADGDGWEHIVEVIAEKIDDDAWSQCSPTMDDSGDFDYTEHDSTDTDNSKIDYSKDEIRQAVLGFLRERHPDLASQLPS